MFGKETNNYGDFNTNTYNGHKKNKKIIFNPINIQNPFNEKIIQLFIYIFYYEKYLSENKYNSFNNDENYYLINPYWIENCKKYYNYEKFYHLLLNINKRNNSINYNNLEIFYEKIFIELFQNINFEDKELSQDLLKTKNINCSVKRNYDILYIHEGFIFPLKIIQLIKNLSEKFKYISNKELYFKTNKIIYINKPNKIIIGILNSINLLIPQYVFVFNSCDILEKEKINILSNSFSIDEYIKNSLPIENNNNYRILKNENNEEVYKLLYLKKQHRRVKSNNCDCKFDNEFNISFRKNNYNLTNKKDNNNEKFNLNNINRRNLISKNLSKNNISRKNISLSPT